MIDTIARRRYLINDQTNAIVESFKGCRGGGDCSKFRESLTGKVRLKPKKEIAAKARDIEAFVFNPLG